MRRIYVIAPLEYLLLLCEISLHGEGGFEALYVIVGHSTKLKSASLRRPGARYSIRFLHHAIDLSQCHPCAVVGSLFEPLVGNELAIDIAISAAKHKALSVKFVHEHALVPHLHMILFYIMVDLAVEDISQRGYGTDMGNDFLSQTLKYGQGQRHGEWLVVFDRVQR